MINQPFFQVALPLMVTILIAAFTAVWSSNKRIEELSHRLDDTNRPLDDVDRRFGDVDRRFDEVMNRSSLDRAGRTWLPASARIAYSSRSAAIGSRHAARYAGR